MLKLKMRECSPELVTGVLRGFKPYLGVWLLSLILKEQHGGGVREEMRAGPGPSLPSCVPLGKSLSLSEPGLLSYE